ncbi:hypothetical protein KSP39_PZI010875 [Platanthera zijinensis]|uniref:Transcription factor CBF/NF-Y/archaeal histone domain-containing protein n=1 Tax=Platanthera zijinensis TaxID=2320716 RepID=A0AAP0BGI1_9ASPA
MKEIFDLKNMVERSHNRNRWSLKGARAVACKDREFINLVSSESNDVCNREDKRTIAPEHVLKALEVLGFGDYIEEVYAAYEQHKLETLDSPKGGRFSGIEMTEEEAAAEQQRMFAEARARMNNGVAPQKEPEPDRSFDAQNANHV